jgi:signal transduction histidine kinase
MLHSIRIRLLLTFMSIIIVSISAVAIFASLMAQTAFNDYFMEQSRADQATLHQLITTYEQQKNLTWLQLQVDALANTAQTRILLIDDNQRVIVDSAHMLDGKTLSFNDIFALGSCPSVSSSPCFNNVRIISLSNQQTAFGPMPLHFDSDDSHSPPPIFVQLMNTSMIMTMLIATSLALMLTFIFSSRILQPIKALTSAARKMEQGDLSQRVQKEGRDEIGTLAHAFNTMADSLERSEQLRQNLISDVAHELRTPLTNIRGYLEALLDGVTEPTPTAIASIYEEALLLSRLTSDLQDLTQAEAGQLPLMRSPVAIEDIINKAVNGIRVQADAKQITIEMNTTPDLPLVNADPERIGQIMRNLLNNAITHTQQHGHITISASVLRHEVEISVRDTGNGIAAEHLPHIFKRFYRTDPSRARTTGGSGLGLAIVEQLVKAHGGNISVESEVGKGTCFTFTVPLA